MAFPDINPIKVGLDGWSPTYDTKVSRLLYLCGLRAQRLHYNASRRQSVISWRLSDEASRQWQYSTFVRIKKSPK